MGLFSLCVSIIVLQEKSQGTILKVGTEAERGRGSWLLMNLFLMVYLTFFLLFDNFYHFVSYIISVEIEFYHLSPCISPRPSPLLSPPWAQSQDDSLFLFNCYRYIHTYMYVGMCVHKYCNYNLLPAESVLLVICIWFQGRPLCTWQSIRELIPEID